MRTDDADENARLEALICNSLFRLEYTAVRAAAMAEANWITDKLVAAAAWRLLSDLNANMQRRDEALRGARNRTATSARFAPTATAARVAPGAKRRSGSHWLNWRFRREAADSPELLVHLGRALRHAGEPNVRRPTLQQRYNARPGNVSPHKLLAAIAPRLARPAGAVAAWPHQDQSQPSRGRTAGGGVSKTGGTEAGKAGGVSS